LMPEEKLEWCSYCGERHARFQCRCPSGGALVWGILAFVLGPPILYRVYVFVLALHKAAW